MIIPLEKEADILFLERTFPMVWKQGSILSNMKNNPNTYYRIYQQNEQILGCINYTIFFERMELVDLYVVTSAWNQGIGSKLLNYMFEEAIRHGVESITLEVSEENAKALYLYQKYGFVKIAKRKGYYQGVDAWLLERKMGSK